MGVIPMNKLFLTSILLILCLSLSVQAATVTYAVKNGQTIISEQQPIQGCCGPITTNNNAVEYYTYHESPKIIFPYQRIVAPTTPCCTIKEDFSTYYYTQHIQPTTISVVNQVNAPTTVNNYYTTYYGSAYGHSYRNYGNSYSDGFSGKNQRSGSYHTYSRTMTSNTNIAW
ncbi:MAG: hypothetical protein Q7R96_03430 [Nanoarchaeota archaeon]|nr:hypothetical protein [Nanoarchaeota archaeon]